MSKPIIEVRNISKQYKISHRLMHNANPTIKEDLVYLAKKPLEWIGAIHGSEKEAFWALNDVSFDIEKGSVVGIMGKNGSGKSTLFKILSQITEPTSGTAVMRGRVASLLEVGTGFHPELTGRENVYFNGSILGMSKSEIDKEFDNIVAFSEVEKFLDTPTKFYSSGMKVRLAFSVAAHLKPEILLIDEVLAVGDVRFKQKSIEHMKKVAATGTTILFVSHIVHQVEKICTTGILLSHGKIVQQGSLEETIDQYLSLNKVTEDVGGESDIDNYSRGYVGKDIEVKVNDISVKPKDKSAPGLVIDLEVTNKTEASNPELWLGAIIADQTGKNITMASTETSGVKLVVDKSKTRRLRLEINELNLLPDTYTLRLNMRTAELGQKKKIFQRLEMKEALTIPDYNFGSLAFVGPRPEQPTPPMIVDHKFIVE